MLRALKAVAAAAVGEKVIIPAWWEAECKWGS